MMELPDDELDKLFRKSSEELDPTFEPNDWSELKKRLDAEDGITPGGWWRKWWPVGLVLLFLGGAAGSYFLFSVPDETLRSKSERSVDKYVVSDSASGLVPGIKEKDKQNAAQPDTAAYGEIKVADGNASPDAPTARDKTLPRRLSKAGGVHLEPDHFVGKGGDGAFSATARAAERKIARRTPESLEKVKGGRNAAELSDITQTFGAIGDRLDSRGDGGGVFDDGKEESHFQENRFPESRFPENRFPENRFPENAVAQGDIKTVSGLAEVNPARTEAKASEGVVVALAEPVAYRSTSWDSQTEIVAPEATMSDLKPDVNASTPFLAIRFGYSPDLSTVGLKNFSKPGSAFSIMGELAVVPRLYLQTGVVRSVKEYSAGGSDYTFSKYVTDIATPDNVDGTCKMFEIPMGLRFDALRMERSSLFAGTGMSSYYVQNEKYKYNYSQYVYGAKKGWEGSTGWFWLSHINASVGYEYKVAPRLSLLAEPYLRIPVKRVGYGKVNLTTTGVWISIRYVPVFR